MKNRTIKNIYADIPSLRYSGPEYGPNRPFDLIYDQLPNSIFFYTNDNINHNINNHLDPIDDMLIDECQL